jgi:hypothetical protein
MPPLQNNGDPSLIVFASQELVPKAWRGHWQATDFQVLNPAITTFGRELLMSYRVVTPDRRRRLATCRLDPSLRVIPNSLTLLSDSIHNGGDWHADPRWLIHQGQLFVHYNTGDHPSPNTIFLLEVDPDTLEARAPARPLTLEGPRQLVEKNWMLFDHDGDLYAVYWISPHVILRVDMRNAGPIRCRQVHTVSWDAAAYTRRYGELRSGTPPNRCGDRYYAFFHSACPVGVLARWSPWLALLPFVRRYRWRLAPLRYVGGFYGFAAAPPFEPVCFVPQPILHEPPQLRRQGSRRRLDARVECVAFPVGAVLSAEGRWLVSFGALNAYCCLSVFQHQALLAQSVPCEANNRVSAL